jgi:XrtJ-associated TM-motif-TM protein
MVGFEQVIAFHGHRDSRHSNQLKGHLPMTKNLLRLTFLASLLLIPCLAHAQNGCIDSPECPTAVLGLVGAAGAALFARLRAR